MKKFPYPLYLVMNKAACTKQDWLWLAEEAILGGVDVIQLREKEISESEFVARALALKNITDRYKVPLIINDNLFVAKAVDAAGIHVGNEDITPSEIRQEWAADKYIGYSVQKADGINPEVLPFVDYLAVSPVFLTATKPRNLNPWGIEGIKSLRTQTDFPLVGIGSMKPENAQEVWQAGVQSIAVVTAICEAEDPRMVAQSFKQQMQLS